MKQIEQYNDLANYNADGKPTTASRVANIKSGNLSLFDGINVPTTDTPQFGDAVYVDTNGNKIAIRKEVYNRNLVPSDWTYKGVFLNYYKDGRWRVFLGNYTSLPTPKYADVIQFRVTIPAATGTITMGARFVSVDANTSISVQYEEGMILAAAANTYEINDETLCGRINTALSNVEGITGTWWSYLNDDGNVILQRDTWSDYRQYNCSGSLTFVVWGTMPESSSYRKVNGKSTNYRGIMNFSGAQSYWSTNGRTLTANVAVHSESGNTDPMKLSEFNNSAYAAEIRAYYKKYIDYLRGEFGIMANMKVGAFGLADGATLSDRYAANMAPKKDGTTKAKFPAMYWAYQQGGHLIDVAEGVLMLNDDNLKIINATQTKAGKVTLSNASSRWFCQRYSVFYAWFFNGTRRNLSYYDVPNTIQAVAVALL